MNALRPLPGYKPCEILKSQATALMANEWVKMSGFIPNDCWIKSWDICHYLPYLTQGSILDMGASLSYPILNAMKAGLTGPFVAIDLNPPRLIEGAIVLQGDLLKVPYSDESFDQITSLSVIEHGVDTEAFFKEVYRLLKPNGTLHLTFDYWPEEIKTSEGWTIFNRASATKAFDEARLAGLKIVEPMDWTVGEVVITPQNYSPDSVSYTFGAAKFTKES